MAKTPKKPAPKKGGVKKAAPKKAAPKKAAALPSPKPRPRDRFKGEDVALALKVAANCALPAIEFHAEVTDYGWRLTLVASEVVGDEQLRAAIYVDQSGFTEAQRALWNRCDSRAEFVRAWVSEVAPKLEAKLMSWRPEWRGPVATERQADQLAAETLAQARFASTQPKRHTAEAQQADQLAADTMRAQALADMRAQALAAATAPASFARAKPTLWARFRSAITGLFVSKKYAEANPHTTVREKVKG